MSEAEFRKKYNEQMSYVWAEIIKLDGLIEEEERVGNGEYAKPFKRDQERIVKRLKEIMSEVNKNDEDKTKK